MSARFFLACIGTVMVFACSYAQSLNIDLDVAQASPPLGGGAPSSAFGAAAGQAGFWNAMDAVSGLPFSPLGLDGAATSASVTRQSQSGNGVGGAFFFEGNTGDFALLLNDAATITDVLTFTFSGFQAGTYDVYTYAVNIRGRLVPIPIEVATIAGSVTQVVTGPMPGNAFGNLITHSINRIELAQGEQFRVIGRLQTGIEESFDINGFQIVAVPEPSAALMLTVLVTTLWRRRR